MTDYYTEQARAEDAAEQARQAEQRIADRANALREADVREVEHSSLCRKLNIPQTSSPAQVAKAYRDRRSEVIGAVAGSSPHGHKLRALAVELGLDPNNLACPTSIDPHEVIWQAMLAQNHRLLRATRDPATGAMIAPSDARVDKLAALAARPGTDGEGAAAQAALDRIAGVA